MTLRPLRCMLYASAGTASTAAITTDKAAKGEEKGSSLSPFAGKLYLCA